MSDKPDHIGLDSKPQAERDRIDFNLEIAGETVGRNHRFLVADGHGFSGEESKEKKREREFQTLLDYLLNNDAQYARLYHQVEERLNTAQQAVDRALIEIDQRLEASAETLQNMRDRAGTLEDGTKVFLSTDNVTVYTEAGKRLTDLAPQEIAFPADAPSWEAYRTEQEAHDLAQRQREEVKTYQHDVLDHAHERMNEKNEPPSMDELETLNAQIEETMPEVAKAQYRLAASKDYAVESSSLSAAQSLAGKPDLSVPDVSAVFNTARLDIPKVSDVAYDRSGPTTAPVIP